jgi:uncharacterized protein YlxW (UPF0749 family)
VNPFATRFQNQSWIWPVSIMCMILGFMISLAWLTKENVGSRLAFMQPDQRDRVNQAAVDIQAFQQLSSEVNKLRQEKTEMENALAKRGQESSILNESLQDIKVFAAMTAVEGPGVVITLKDSAKGEVELTDEGVPLSDYVIHDEDVLKTVNELFAAGAEAISINQHRVGVNTSIRCVGPTILVNDVKIASPVVIRAIGDPDTLYGGLTIPGGVLTMIRQMDSSMVKVEKVESQELPGFVGKTTTQYINVPEEKPGVKKDK